MNKLFKGKPEIYPIAFIALIVAVSSQFYFNVFASSFRISIAIIVLPLLSMTVGESVNSIKIGLATAVNIFILRSIIHYFITGSFEDIFIIYIPNAVFYIVYGIIFHILCPNKFVVSYTRLLYTIFVSDFLSNIVEICITNGTAAGPNAVDIIVTLATIAVVRSSVAWILLVAEKNYRTLLKREEHENRYQRLFLMTTGLKNEIYFMKKNSEEIENVMGTAYRLYEHLSDTDLSPEIKKMSLELARDVHEIKKDYIRIIKGIENEISEDYDEKHMYFSDILHILKDTTYHLLQSKRIKVTLDFTCKEDFLTDHHYELMNILKNLVTNAIEAIDQGEKGDTITILQYMDKDDCVIEVMDNGMGISKRHINNIFHMGYSTKFDTRSGNIYRGVGLYGVKGTVEEKFGGSIKVDSIFGDGTNFVVKLPKESIICEK